MTRRSYVSVNGEWVDKHLVQQEPRADYQIMPDIKPYRSMANGEIIHSRSRHREHLRDHGMIEVGNELDYLKPKPPPDPKGLKESLIRATFEEYRRRK